MLHDLAHPFWKMSFSACRWLRLDLQNSGAHVASTPAKRVLAMGPPEPLPAGARAPARSAPHAAATQLHLDVAFERTLGLHVYGPVHALARLRVGYSIPL